MTTLDDKEKINTYNLECQKLLFYCNSLIAGVLKERTINKNAKITQIKNEFNRRVVLLKNNLKIIANSDAIANASANADSDSGANADSESGANAYSTETNDVTDAIPIVCCLIPNNIMLNITLKKR